MACRLLAAACMQDLVRRAGIEPGPPALGAQSLIHWATREVPAVILCCDSEAHILWVLAYLLLYLYVILFVLYFLSFLSGTLKCICSFTFSIVSLVGCV